MTGNWLSGKLHPILHPGVNKIFFTHHQKLILSSLPSQHLSSRSAHCDIKALWSVTSKWSPTTDRCDHPSKILTLCIHCNVTAWSVRWQWFPVRLYFDVTVTFVWAHLELNLSTNLWLARQLLHKSFFKFHSFPTLLSLRTPSSCAVLPSMVSALSWNAVAHWLSVWSAKFI